MYSKIPLAGGGDLFVGIQGPHGTREGGLHTLRPSFSKWRDFWPQIKFLALLLAWASESGVKVASESAWNASCANWEAFDGLRGIFGIEGMTKGVLTRTKVFLQRRR